jgi:hypothetical protein
VAGTGFEKQVNKRLFPKGLLRFVRRKGFERRRIGTFYGIDSRDYLGTVRRSFVVSAAESYQ